MSAKILDAVKNNLYSQLILYLKHGYNFKVKSSDGFNALMVALTIPNVEKRYKMFEFLLRNDCIDVLDTDQDGKNIFFWTIKKQCVRELDLLMRNYHMEIDWTQVDNSGKTLLHYAVLTNNPVIMSLLLKYCSKFKINVDIPDKKDKITPYLLACRLNFLKIADLLVKFGHASKNQFDENSHLNANEWKEEGKIEKFKDYLKIKKMEMQVAKLNGQINKYKELNNLSKSLNLEVHKNPEIIPVFAKALMDHEESQTNAFDMSINFENQMNINEYEIIESLEGTNDEYQNRQRSPIGDMELNKIIKNTMNSIMGRNKPLDEVNSLLEMTNGQIADHFVASKSYVEVNQIKTENNWNSINSNEYNSMSNHNLNLNGIVDIFQIAAYQQSGNYRSPAKYVVPKAKIKPKKKQKVKSGLSTLAIIREESRLGANSKKISKQSAKAKTIIKQSKSMPIIHINDNKMRLKTIV